MATLQRVVFVELDVAVLHGLKDYAASANNVLAPHGITVDDVAFARFFIGRTGSAAVAAALGKAGATGDADALASRILDEFKPALLKRVASVKAACAKFAAPLLARDIRVAWVTQLSEADVREALGEGALVMSETAQLVGCHGWESWRRLCRKLNVHERLCAAVVGSGPSAKGAVSSGLYVAACADPLAQNQDFGGVDVMAETINEALAKDVLRMLWQKT